MLLAPLSEYFGRSPVYLVSWFFLFIFQLPVALAPNIGTLLVCRFFHGLGGAVPLASTGGAISDLWKRNDSGNAMAVYTFSSTAGPPLGLVVSGYIALEKEWRWQFWVYMATTGGFWLIVIVRLPMYLDRFGSTNDSIVHSTRDATQHYPEEESCPRSQDAY